MLQVKLEKPGPENSCLIELTQGKFAIVDRPMPPGVMDHKWRAVKWNFRWYAYSTRTLAGKCAGVAMHRLIANTPIGEVCHHANKNSLDNRRPNLMNMSNRFHGELHRIRKWGHS